MGVRRAESVKRSSIYKEPIECRFYGSKIERVEAVYPLLEWSDRDVACYIESRGIKVHNLYYKEDGCIDPKRRLGCMCCPLQGRMKRIESFKKFPGMVKLYIKAGHAYLLSHPNTKTTENYIDVYEWFYRDVFCSSQSDIVMIRNGFFGVPDYKDFLMNFFGVEL